MSEYTEAQDSAEVDESPVEDDSEKPRGRMTKEQQEELAANLGKSHSTLTS